MAKTKRVHYTKAQLMSIDNLTKLNEKELRTAVNDVRDIVNKRVNRLLKADRLAPALIGLVENAGFNIKANPEDVTAYKNEVINIIKSGGAKITPKGKTANQLEKELRRGLDFLSYKTGTKRGFEKTRKEVSEKVGFDLSDLTEDEETLMWQLYHAMEEDPQIGAMIGVAGKGGSPQYIQQAKEMIKSGKTDKVEMLEKVRSAVRANYEDRQEGESLYAELFGDDDEELY